MIGADRSIRSDGRTCKDIERNRGRCTVKAETRVAVTDARVVATDASKFVEGAARSGVYAVAAKARRIIGIAEVRAADRLDRNKGIGAYRLVAEHFSLGKLNVDPGRNRWITVIVGTVEA